MDIKWKLYKLWSVEMSPLCSAAAAAMVQIGKVKYSSVGGKMLSQTPAVSRCDHAQYVTSTPDGV